MNSLDINLTMPLINKYYEYKTNNTMQKQFEKDETDCVDFVATSL